ncbi:MAG: protein tyrosine phosphatase [Sandaracinaceae bacterium]|nr:protein tyrosine phosphatase [Sandaracinaceae bacterium]
MSGFVDLHCHYVPGVDDGVRTLDESQRLLRGLAALGYTEVVATPHIRTAMFENRKPGLTKAFDELTSILGPPAPSSMPRLSLAAEHFCDDVFFGLLASDQVLPYRGGFAILLEFRYEAWPRKIEEQLFRMQVRGLRPLIAHPERYYALFDETDPLDPLLDVGAMTLLDTMSLSGKYGERCRRAAERMLEEGAYDAACSDAHRPEDVDVMGRSIERLRALVGKEEAQALLSTRPRGILDGSYDP